MVNFLKRKAQVNKHRIGRRGAVLLVAGFIYTVLGVAYALLPIAPTTRDQFAFPIYIAPLGVWGGVYLAVGLVAIVTAFWPTGRDAWGFAVIAGFTLVWAVFGVLSTVIFDSDRGWVISLVWFAYAGILIIVSGMRGAYDE